MPCWQNKRHSKIPKPQLAVWEKEKNMSDIKLDLFTWCPGVELNHGHRDFQSRTPTSSSSLMYQRF